MAERLELCDMQGIVASAYLHLAWANYVLLRIDASRAAEARNWLASIAGSITPATQKNETQCVNVALSCEGLRKLGVDAASLQTFSRPFLEGMRSERRARILGDDSCGRLRWGEPDSPVDVLLLTFADTQARLDEIVARLVAAAESCGLQNVATLEGRIYPDRREHFGFVDGVSQPVIKSLVPARSRAVHARDVIENGEVVLGYRNAYGRVADAPKLGSSQNLGRNGTYLVFRQTSQNVARFREFLDRAATRACVSRDLLEAKIIGRWPSGVPLVRAPHADDPALAAGARDDGDTSVDPANDFGFAEDPDGFRCPLGSHIRRANPRDGSLQSQATTAAARSARHRLLRRGRSYGPRFEPSAADAERGLQFIALCADLERHFEFVQQTWLNNPGLNDLDEVDPLVGGCAKPTTFTLQGGPVRRRISGMESFVTLRGGGYFFVPSLKALAWLAGSPEVAPCAQQAAPTTYEAPSPERNVAAAAAS